jgi:hypothetical protein
MDFHYFSPWTRLYGRLGCNDLVEQADLLLQMAWDEENVPLFRDVSKVGRLQQLEGAVIVGLELNAGKYEEAAQLAMRMMVEDEFIINSSFDIAALLRRYLYCTMPVRKTVYFSVLFTFYPSLTIPLIPDSCNCC